MNESLHNYIKTLHEKGSSDEVIKSNLLSQGWDKNQVDAALKQSQDSEEVPIPVPPSVGFSAPQASQTSPSAGPLSADPSGQNMRKGNMWDSFQHILMFISMYVLWISLMLMINTFIDRWVPAPSSYYGSIYSSYSNYAVTGYMSSIIVSFPLFAFFFIKLTKDTKKNPFIRNLRSRKHLIYITLVVTFIVVLSKVVQIVYSFLEGNVTANFLLHFVNIVGSSGLIFAYYLGQVKEDRKP